MALELLFKRQGMGTRAHSEHVLEYGAPSITTCGYLIIQVFLFSGGSYKSHGLISNTMLHFQHVFTKLVEGT